MTLLSVDIKSVRNVNAVFEAHPNFNVFYGQNGSGKTSVLEAISLLGSGKSFRQPSIHNIIQHESQALSLFGWLLTRENLKKPVGMEKSREGKTQIRLDGESVSVAVLAENLPLQLIHPESDVLIAGPPKWRRQFVDWGTFHVEPSFFSAWQIWQKVLKQRNAVLKLTQDRMQTSAWDAEYSRASEAVSHYRKLYLEDFLPYFQEMIKYFLPEKEITLTYQQGWPENYRLEKLLDKNFYRDFQAGYTIYGPQRDDIAIYCGKVLASDVLSRGEQKLTVIALRLAQGKYLKEQTQKRCIYLLDDFSAELDHLHRRQVIEILSLLDSQIFLTTIDYQEVSHSLENIDLKKFHVERGTVCSK